MMKKKTRMSVSTVLSMILLVSEYGVSGETKQEDLPYDPNHHQTDLNFDSSRIQMFLPRTDRWSSWSSWTHCSVSCGEGTHTRTRYCHHHEYCYGDKTQTRSCTSHVSPCPVDGGWGSWEGWTNCDVTCGSGHRSRQRKCDHPAPRAGGQNCHGDSTQQATCTTNHDCPVPTTAVPLEHIHCDKLCTIVLVAEASSTESTRADGIICPDGHKTSSEALIQKCCTLNSTAWMQGPKVETSCRSLPLYTVVGRFTGGQYISDTTGILVGCLDNGFMMALQECGKVPNIIHVTSNTTAEHLESYYSLMTPRT